MYSHIVENTNHFDNFEALNVYKIFMLDFSRKSAEMHEKMKHM